MLKIRKVEVTPFAQNCRVLACTRTKNAAVVDPGGDTHLITAVLAQEHLELEQIWLTHSHLDHCGGVADLKNKSGAAVYAHPLEKELRANVVAICKAYGIPPGSMQNCPEPDFPLNGGEQVTIGDEVFEVLFTPGHSPGHICFYHRESANLIAGDTLFAGSIGRTDLPGGDFSTLISSIKDVIFALPLETAVLPGHGPDTTVAHEKNTNPFLI